jgi:hypothetical protein
VSVYDLGRALLEQREAMRVERDEAVRQRDQLRAFAQALLDDPVPWLLNGRCRLCLAQVAFGAHAQHGDDCPVNRRDEILGRDRAPTHSEGPT